MAHATLHFSAGLVAGTLLAAPALHAAWTARRPLARPILRMLVTAWLLALWALIPSFCRHLNVPEAIVGSLWMNIFLFHPLIATVMRRSMFIGSALMATTCAAHYILILCAIRRARLPAAPPSSRHNAQ